MEIDRPGDLRRGRSRLCRPDVAQSGRQSPFADLKTVSARMKALMPELRQPRAGEIARLPAPMRSAQRDALPKTRTQNQPDNPPALPLAKEVQARHQHPGKPPVLDALRVWNDESCLAGSRAREHIKHRGSAREESTIPGNCEGVGYVATITAIDRQPVDLPAAAVNRPSRPSRSGAAGAGIGVSGRVTSTSRTSHRGALLQTPTAGALVKGIVPETAQAGARWGVMQRHHRSSVVRRNSGSHRPAGARSPQGMERRRELLKHIATKPSGSRAGLGGKQMQVATRPVPQPGKALLAVQPGAPPKPPALCWLWWSKPGT